MIAISISKKFKVFVSRNDSWKQMKDGSNNEEFTGNNSNYKNEKKLF